MHFFTSISLPPLLVGCCWWRLGVTQHSSLRQMCYFLILLCMFLQDICCSCLIIATRMRMEVLLTRMYTVQLCEIRMARRWVWALCLCTRHANGVYSEKIAVICCKLRANYCPICQTVLSSPYFLQTCQLGFKSNNAFCFYAACPASWHWFTDTLAAFLRVLCHIFRYNQFHTTCMFLPFVCLDNKCMHSREGCDII